MIPMIEKSIEWLERITRDLKESASMPSPDTTPREQENQTVEGTEATPDADQTVSAAPIPLWRHALSAERSRLRWLQRHPWVIGIALGLAIVIIVAEQWLIQTWQWLASQASLVWPELAKHPVALGGVGLVLLGLFFGLRWLRYVDDFVISVRATIKKRPGLSTLVGGILLLFGLWFASNYGSWVILPFTEGQVETFPLSGEKVAVQLIAELNQVGVGNPTPVLILWELQEPRTSSGSVTSRRTLPLGKECQAILRGPGDFIPMQRIPLPRVLTGSQGSRLDLGNLSVGSIKIPFQLFTQFILKILPTGYREFNGQINESDGELEISVSSRNPPHAWRVAGPDDAFPEMIEYLALRMALDMNPELIRSSGLETSPSDRDLAFALGNQAFRQQRYRRAEAFFELVDRFEPLDEKADAMLGLTRYHLAPQQPSDDPTRFDSALTAMKAAVQEDPNGDSSLLRPYLACLYQEAGQETEAESERSIFNQYLTRLEARDYEVRVEALRQLPLRGPSRHLSVGDGNVMLVDETGIAVIGFVQAHLPQSDQKPPRQIATYGDSNLLLVTSDGAVQDFTYQVTDGPQTVTILVEGRRLKGVQQIATSVSKLGYTNLVLLNRFGKIYWCRLNTKADGTAICFPRQPNIAELPDARQIFPVEDQIYILAVDGAVSYIEVDESGQELAPRQLTAPAQTQQIFVTEDGALYLLHDNGNVWRYYDDGRAETEDLTLIDGGTNTAQIFAAGGYLYLLKNDGAIWRIGNPRNPAEEDLAEIFVPPEDTTIREMYVVAEQQTSNRTVYLLTDQQVLLQGTDTGNARMTVTTAYPPPATQASAVD